MINITRSKKRFITNEWTKYMVKMKEKIKWERLTKSSLLILFFQRWVSFAALVWSLYITCPTDSSIHCFTLLYTHISVGGRRGRTCEGDNFLNGEPQLKSMKWIGYSNFMLNLCIWQSLKQYQSWSEFYITHMIGVLVHLCFGITVCSKNWIVPQNKYVKYDTLPWETI